MGALSHNNDPNHESMPHWPRYTLDQRATMFFDVPSRVENDPFSAERRFWEDLSGSGL
jgi:para-nitrobenzyl esterase